LVAITGGYLGRDLRQGPRTLEALGLQHHSPAQLREMLHHGERA
jgi:opine dehydrogenase